MFCPLPCCTFALLQYYASLQPAAPLARHDDMPTCVRSLPVQQHTKDYARGSLQKPSVMTRIKWHAPVCQQINKIWPGWLLYDPATLVKAAGKL